MNVLVACEFSGVVREAFINQGHKAMSCDFLDTEIDGPHYKGDVRDILYENWDLMIAHPPCTYLASAGARWWKDKRKEQEDALEFVRLLLEAPIHKIALENPVGIISTRIRPPDQYIQPNEFGHPEAKKTGLWLKNLPQLQPTIIVHRKEDRVHRMSESDIRWMERSRTFIGIANAMAKQWT